MNEWYSQKKKKTCLDRCTTNWFLCLFVCLTRLHAQCGAQSHNQESRALLTEPAKCPHQTVDNCFTLDTSGEPLGILLGSSLSLRNFSDSGICYLEVSLLRTLPYISCLLPCCFPDAALWDTLRSLLYTHICMIQKCGPPLNNGESMDKHLPLSSFGARSSEIS